MLGRRHTGERAVAPVVVVARAAREPGKKDRRRADRRVLRHGREPAALVREHARPVAAREQRGLRRAHHAALRVGRARGRGERLRQRGRPAQLDEVAVRRAVAVVQVRQPAFVGERRAGQRVGAAAHRVLEHVAEIAHRTARDDERRRPVVAAVLKRRLLLRQARRLQRAKVHAAAERTVLRARARARTREQVGVDAEAAEPAARAGELHAVDAGAGLRRIVAVDRDPAAARGEPRKIAERVAQRAVEKPQRIVLTDLARRARRRRGHRHPADLLRPRGARQPHAHARRPPRDHVEQRRACGDVPALGHRRTVRTRRDGLEASVPIGVGISDRPALALQDDARQRHRGTARRIDDVDDHVARLVGGAHRAAEQRDEKNEPTPNACHCDGSVSPKAVADLPNARPRPRENVRSQREASLRSRGGTGRRSIRPLRRVTSRSFRRAVPYKHELYRERA